MFQRIKVCHPPYSFETVISNAWFLLSGNSRTTGLILITFYTESPCISYICNLKLCEDQHKKKKVVLCVKSYTWICNQKDFLLNNFSCNLKKSWQKSSLEKCQISFTNLCATSHCCTSIWCTPFSFKTPWQFTPLLNLCSLIFGLTPFVWEHTWAPPREYGSHTAEQNWEAACSLQGTSFNVCSLFSSEHMVYLHLSNLFYSKFDNNHISIQYSF